MTDYKNYKSRRIRSMTELKPGDHIRVVGQGTSYYHHLLVIEVTDKGSVKVIHKTLKVVEEEVPYKPKDILVLDYKSKYTAAEAIRRARKRLGEENYNPVTANCEHFVTEIRTGTAQSIQIEKAIYPVIVGGIVGALIGGVGAWWLGCSAKFILASAATGGVVGVLAVVVIGGYLVVYSDQSEKEHKD